MTRFSGFEAKELAIIATTAECPNSTDITDTHFNVEMVSKVNIYAQSEFKTPCDQASLAGDGRNYAGMFADTDEMMVLTGAMNMRHHLAAGITTIREHGAFSAV